MFWIRSFVDLQKEQIQTDYVSPRFDIIEYFVYDISTTNRVAVVHIMTCRSRIDFVCCNYRCFLMSGARKKFGAASTATPAIYKES